MTKWILPIAAALICLAGPQGIMAEDKTYVGSETCRDCHQEEYDRFMAYSKKAGSFASIKKMEKKLTPEEFQRCFECHTTGYGKGGGFVSESLTPALKDTGCESCHGPGSLHVDTEDPEDIKGDLTMEDCTVCHDEERVKAFDFKPLLFGGAH